MREAELHVPREAIEELGFETSSDGGQQVSVRDVTLLSCTDGESLSAVTYSEPVDDALENADHVAWWERLGRDGTGTTYLCRCIAPERLEESSTCDEVDPVVRQVTPEDGGFTLTLVGSQDAFRCPAGADSEMDVPVSLRRLSDYEGPADDLDALTIRQREVLETAYEMGYYEVPRRTSADRIARRLDLDRSTVTEHLQRAERNLLSAVLSD